MKVQRITVDADLGLVELKTIPGDPSAAQSYLIPLELPEYLKRFISFPDDTGPELPAIKDWNGEYVLAREVPVEELAEALGHKLPEWQKDNPAARFPANDFGPMELSAPPNPWAEPQTGPGRTEGGGHSGSHLPNPVMVFATKHGQAYELTSPTIPGWFYHLDSTELEAVPRIVRETMGNHGFTFPADIAIATIIKDAR